MSTMDTLEDERSAVEATESVWNALVMTFTDMVHDNGPHLEKILNMIRTDITYDDPGLFPTALLANQDRPKCRCSNYWLIYQLLRIASLEIYASISESYNRLQKEIIKACFIKQRWLALDICSEFIKLLDQMNDFRNGCTETILTFYEDFTNVKTQGIDFKSVTIEINSIARCRLLRMHCLHTISEMISLLVYHHDETSLQLVNDSACTVLRTLVVGNLEEKRVSIVFFQNFFKHHIQTVHVSFPAENIFKVFSLIAVSLKRYNAWQTTPFTNQQGMDAFLDTVTELFTTLNTLHPWPALRQESVHKIFTAAEEILCTSLQHKPERINIEEGRQEQLHITLLGFLQKLEPELLHAGVIFPGLIDCYGTSTSFDDYVVNQIVNQIEGAQKGLTEKNTCNKLLVPLLSTVWAMVLKNVEQNRNILVRALGIANVVHFKLNARLESSSSRPHVQQCFFFESKLSLLEVTPMVELFGTRQKNVIKMAVDIIHMCDCQSLNEQQQLSLLDILFAPFEVVNSDEREKQQRFWNKQMNTEICHYAIEQWCNVRADNLHGGVISSSIKKQLLSLLMFIAANEHDNAMKQTLVKAFPQLILSSKIALAELIKNVLVPLLSTKYENALMVDIIELLRLLSCLRSGCNANFCVYQISEDKRSFRCSQCDHGIDYTEHCNGYCIETVSEKLTSQGKSVELDMHIQAAILKISCTNEEATLLAFTNFLQSALKHSFACMMDEKLLPCWIRLFGKNSTTVCLQVTRHIPSIFQTLSSNLANEPERYDSLVSMVIEQLLSAARSCVMTKTTYAEQMATVRMIAEFTDASYHAALLWKTKEDKETLFHCVRIMIFFLMHPESLVKHEAALVITEMCARQDTSPSTILSWYRHDIIKLIMGLVVSNYVYGGITLHQSINIVSHAFESRDPVDFVGKYYKTMMAMLLPWCLRSSNYDDLLREVAAILRKDLVALLSMSFLSIYTCLFISESVEVTNKCIEYIMQLTGNSFFHLLHSDIKRTVSEVLIYYHINPECVMHAFRSLLSKDTDIDEVSTMRIAEYIAERFLGVLANLEVTLFNPDGEKFLKRLALLSLGDIIRLLGGEHITPFRFKIIALLRTALALPEGAALTKLCVKTWRIFICTVDVRQLGSLLSTIFVTLEPLVDSYNEDIGYIFRYLVIENNSLLGNSLGDLFFIEDTNVVEDIKKIVASRFAKHGHGTDNDLFINRLEELIRHCNHENLKIRAHAFSHLCRLCETGRKELNEAILGQHQSISLSTIATLVETLIRGLCEQDATVQQRAAECLGELGALAPSHLPPNYAPTGAGFALSIHSDCFAIIALRELCRAYQRQKDSKFVDSFSLAIQEVLSERGVSPEADKKREVWETIPERLRPIMEPLLTSCYTTVSKASEIPTVHPVFKNVSSSHEWCYQWAYQMIENINTECTRNLLRAFKPSLRCDRGTLMMMLPYILLHSLQLCEGNDQRKSMVEELHVIFDAAIGHSESFLTRSPANKANETDDMTSASATELNVCIPQECTDTSSKELALQCAKYAFGLFDFLEQWKRQYFKDVISKDKVHNSNQHNYDVVNTFLNTFDSDLLALVNLQCHEYARALQYVEHSLSGEDKNKKLQDKLSILSDIYSNLGDTDSVEGVMALKATEPTLNELIRYHNATGRLQETVACYERLLQLTNIEEQPQGLHYVNSMIECYLKLDQPETALLLAESLLVRFHDTTLHKPLLDIQTEPLYRLGRFEELEDLIQQRQADQVTGAIVDEQRHWGVICGSLIIEFRQPDYERFCSEIERARRHVVQGSCSDRTISRPLDTQLGTYESRYDQALKLHIIQEFVKFGRIMHTLRLATSNQCAVSSTASTVIEQLNTLVDNLNARLEVLQPNAATMEPIISIRRILLKEIRRTIDEIDWKEPNGEKRVHQLRHLVDQTIGQLWMKSTELASRANMYQQALLYILHAESYRPPDLFIKNAKLLWDRRDITGALKVLERGVNEIVGDVVGSSTDKVNLKGMSKEMRLIYAEGKLLIAAYNAEASNISASVNQRYFKEAVELNPESELALVQLAQYVDRLYSSCPATEQNSPNCWEMMFEVMKCYGKSMMYGSSYIYQSMPRVLSIWLDSTAKTWPKSDEPSSTSSSMSRKISQSMNKLANRFKDTLSPYFFFTAFSQLISRVAHPSQETFQVLKAIIVKLLLNYPQQTLWMMLSVYKSSYTNRVRRCVEIFNDRQLQQPDIQKLIKDFNGLAERLIELTNKEIPGSAGGIRNTAKITVSGLVKALPKLLAEKNFSNIVIPIERCMQLVLNKNTGTAFQPFPTHAIYIAGITEEVTVLQSLQKPRKISLRGHNGKLYTMMMKPKDDLRKDFRLMEFNAVVKQYLFQDPDAKARRLHIRTYAVLPLNEECGIIEWISNLNTFRGIVCTYYKQRGLGMTSKELKNYAYDRTEPLAKKRHAFETILVPRHPPLFSEWFRDCFPNPHNWFQARSSYIKTTAVISMVGYILGLGDRHGENILFDSTNGDTVHVDFNCLFNRGETFTIPELVPFRLTHNMVNAMGPLGVEGMYRRCCEIVLRILQTHAPTFMSVLKPFIYDPMVSWSKISSAVAHFGQTESSSRDNNVERTDPQAMHNVLNIEERLKGYVKIQGKLSHIPLSIEGQVNHLIKEATDIDNLSQMYIGWSGYT